MATLFTKNAKVTCFDAEQISLILDRSKNEIIKKRMWVIEKGIILIGVNYDEFHNIQIVHDEIMLVNMYKKFNKSDFLKVVCKNEILTESIILHRNHFIYSWKDM